MVRQTSSSVMVGRAAELTVLHDAFRTSLSGSPQWVLVSGEAGLGKTRLLAEFIASLHMGGSTGDPLVAVGQCVDLGTAGVPFGPIKEMLRGLSRQIGLDAVSEAAGPGRSLLATLLPELGDDLPSDADELIYALAQLLTALSAVRPLVLVVEDVHWADAATIALLRGLLRAQSTGTVTTVISYRTEEADRGHPVRPLLVDLGRGTGVTPIPLERLTLDQVGEQAAGLLGSRLDHASLQRLFQRSEGVPFFVEELAHWGVDEAMPDSLRDLMLARYDRLDPAAQQVLRLAAIGGVRVPHEILAAVFDGDLTVLDRVARDAVKATVLLRDRDSYVFRHALLRESVQDELMPGERSRYHRRYAAALSENPAGRWAEIAHHWLAGHDVRSAFSATIAALAETDADAAPASAGALARQAADLWLQVPDADEIAGTDRISLLTSLVHLLMASGDLDAAGETADQALALVGASDPSRRAELLHLKYRVVTSLGDGADEQPLREALASLPEPTTDDEHVRHAAAVASLAYSSAVEDAHAEAVPLLEHAVAEALAAGGRVDASRAVAFLGYARAAAGDVDGAWEAFDRVVALDPSPRGYGWLASLAGQVWTWLGEFAAAVELAERAFSPRRERGAVKFVSVFAIEAEAWLGLGDPDAAAAAIARGSRLAPPISSDQTHVSIQQVLVDVWRDDLLSADVLLLTVQPLAARWGSDPPSMCGAFAAAAELELARNAPERAWAEIAGWLDSRLPAPGLDLQLLALGAAALGALRRRGIAPDAAAEQQLRRVLAERSVWPVARNWTALIDAELSGADGDGTSVDAWRAAVAAAEDGRLGADKRVYARLRLAEALLGVGDRSGAAELLAESRVLAGQYQALRRIREIDELVARASLSTGDRAAQTDDPNRLTPREKQVLGLIAEGLSNRQIGERLFISTKTASVHVSAILRKLGVSGRTEAALIAERQRS